MPTPPPPDEPLTPSPHEPTDAAASPFASERIGVAQAPPTMVTSSSELVEVTGETTIVTPAETPTAETVAVVTMTPVESTRAETTHAGPSRVESAPIDVARVGPTRADEPAVTDVAPLAAVATPVPPAAARVAPIVVKTRTGPVALDAQPPAPIVPRPAPVAIRETVAVAPVVVPKPARLASLDIFRGITIAMMVLVNNDGIGHPYGPLDHAAWHGWTPTDLVFPFFLFIVGVATPFSLGKRSAFDGASRGALLGRVWLRALSLMLLGWLLSAAYAPLPWRGLPPGGGYWFTTIFRGLAFPFAIVSIFALLVPWRSRRAAAILPLAIATLLIGYAVAMHFVRARAIANHWDPETFGGGLANPDRMRIPGVLVRIGVCYGVAASIALLGGRIVAWLAILALFAGYSWLMLAGHFEGHTVGSLTQGDNFAHSIDAFLLQRGPILDDGKHAQDHAWREYVDNEGLVSTLPAIGTALIGVLVGWWLRRADRTPAEKCAGLLARGVVVTCAGVLLSWWLMPINKNLWTPSFSVFTAGLAMLGLGAIFWTADVRQRRWWLWPFRVFGVNAIAAFVASSLISRLNGLVLFKAFNPFDRKVETMSAVGLMQAYAADGVVRAGDWLHGHAAWVPNVNTPQNTSLAGALAFVCVIFVLMLVLYACRIFVKV